MDHPDAIPAALTPAELVALDRAARARLSEVDRTRLAAEIAEYRRELCPKGWRWDLAKSRQARRRRAENELVSVSGFAA